jgi:hypothetical protein
MWIFHLGSQGSAGYGICALKTSKIECGEENRRVEKGVG